MRRALLLICAPALVALTPAARGQSNDAVATGTAVDPQHPAVAAATIEFKSAGTGAA